jgi:hypothetical protein
MAALAALVFFVPALISAAVVFAWRPVRIDTTFTMCALFALVAIVLTSTFVVVFRGARVRRRRRFRGRIVEPFDDWYRRHYADSGFYVHSVQTILEAFATEVGGGIAPTQFQPDDRLEDFALTFWGVPTDDSFEYVDAVFEEAFAGTIPSADNWHTLDDVIRSVAIYPAAIDEEGAVDRTAVRT